MMKFAGLAMIACAVFRCRGGRSSRRGVAHRSTPRLIRLPSGYVGRTKVAILYVFAEKPRRSKRSWLRRYRRSYANPPDFYKRALMNYFEPVDPDCRSTVRSVRPASCPFNHRRGAARGGILQKAG